MFLPHIHRISLSRSNFCSPNGFDLGRVNCIYHDIAMQLKFQYFTVHGGTDQSMLKNLIEQYEKTNYGQEICAHQLL